MRRLTDGVVKRHVLQAPNGGLKFFLKLKSGGDVLDLPSQWGCGPEELHRHWVVSLLRGLAVLFEHPLCDVFTFS